MSYRKKEQALSILPGLKSFVRILNELPDLQVMFLFICFLPPLKLLVVTLNVT